VADRVVRWVDVRYAMTAGFLGVLSVLLGVLASKYDTFPTDTVVNAAVRRLGIGFEPIAYTFNELVVYIAVGVIGIVTAALAARRQWRAVAVVAAVMALRPVLNVPKALVGRPRPSRDFPIRDLVSDSSFPSGHTMTATMVFALLFMFAPRVVPRRAVGAVRVLSVASVVLTGMSRMWASVHWFSDTWGAVIWALAAVFAVLALQSGFGALGERVRGDQGRGAGFEPRG